MTNVPYESEYFGRISYDAGLVAQEAALARLESTGLSAIVLGLEHEPVITLGVRGKVEIDLVTPESEILERGFIIRQTHRGGQATLHAPGQLVIYPICNLRKLGLGARDYVCTIEKATGSWLTSLGVQWRRSEQEPGIFVGSEKLVAFGFRIAHGKSSHGLAINVTNPPSDFSLIRTCGVGGQMATNLKAQGAPIDLAMLFSSWLTHFYAILAEDSAKSACEA
jgi:lipoyl(octanoyl) transferase